VPTSSFIKRWSPLAAIILVIAVYLALAHRLKPVADGEPDLYFQMAMARMVASHGMVTQLPQAENLHWDQGFPDKNLFYDLLTGALYKVGGESLTRCLPEILGSLLLILLFMQATSISGRPWMTLSGIALLLLTPIFVVRIILMRPHLLAVVFFSWILWAVLQRRSRWLAISCALFALSYHAIYMPLLVILLGAIFWRDEKRKDRNLYLSGLVGLFFGVFLSPSFPGNLWFGYINARIALDPSQSVPLVAEELKRLTLTEFLKMYGAYLLLLVGALITWNRFDRFIGRNSISKKRCHFLTVLTAVLWLMTALSPRALEYAAISSVFLISALPEFLPGKIKRSSIAFASLVILAACPFAYQYYTPKPETPGQPDRVLQAVDQIPHNSVGAKVFNCEWVSSPYLLYRRPDLRFVDLWGPYLLYWVDPVAHRLRDRVVSGESSFPYGTIQDYFHSQYVLCMDHRFVNQMESDPNFVRLYPETGNVNDYQTLGFPFLYRVEPEPNEHFARNFEVMNKQAQWDTLSFGKTGIKPIYLDLNQWLELLGSGRHLSYINASDPCLKIRPSPEELGRFSKSTFIGVGGGPKMRVTLNGKPLFESGNRPGPYRSIQILIPLPRPLGNQDKIEAEICPARGTSFGFALSFWDRPDLKNICKGRGGDSFSSDVTAPYADRPQMTCLAPVAERTRD
jgi:hypothetical protein